MRPACLSAAGLFAAVWALGEARGALLGAARVSATAELSETKPVTASTLGPKA
jgi:hypothetical protein